MIYFLTSLTGKRWKRSTKLNSSKKIISILISYSLVRKLWPKNEEQQVMVVYMLLVKETFERSAQHAYSRDFFSLGWFELRVLFDMTSFKTANPGQSSILHNFYRYLANFCWWRRGSRVKTRYRYALLFHEFYFLILNMNFEG